MQDLLNLLADKKFVPEKQRDCYQHRVRQAFSCSHGCSNDGTYIRTFQELPGPANLQNTFSAQVPGCDLLGVRNPLDW